MIERGRARRRWITFIYLFPLYYSAGPPRRQFLERLGLMLLLLLQLPLLPLMSVCEACKGSKAPSGFPEVAAVASLWKGSGLQFDSCSRWARRWSREAPFAMGHA